jgi:hypothetical protein
MPENPSYTQTQTINPGGSFDQSVSNPEVRRAMRLAIRDAILSTKPKSKIINAFGQDIEIRQPTLAAVMSYQQIPDRIDAASQMLIRYAYVPGTDTQIFDEEDIEAIKGIPFGEDMQKVNDAINELMSIQVAIKEEEKNSEAIQPVST